MTVKQSSNILPNMHQVVTLHFGENYWFNGCAKYVMECLNEEVKIRDLGQRNCAKNKLLF